MTEYDEYGREYYDYEDDAFGYMAAHPEKYVERPEADPGIFGDHNYNAWDEHGNRTNYDTRGGWQ